MAENYLNEHTQKQQDILKKKRKELADIDADMEDLMNVAGDGDYNLKILNDAFEGRGADNEEIDLINIDGELKIKKRTKRPPIAAPKKPDIETPSAAFAAPIKEDLQKKAALGQEKAKAKAKAAAPSRDPRVASVVEEVMRMSAAGFGKNLNSQPDDQESVSQQTDSYSMALVPVDEAEMKRRRNERLKA